MHERFPLAAEQYFRFFALLLFYFVQTATAHRYLGEILSFCLVRLSPNGFGCAPDRIKWATFVNETPWTWNAQGGCIFPMEKAQRGTSQNAVTV